MVVDVGLKRVLNEAILTEMLLDCVQGSHFGRQAQPYAAEALTWLKDTIEGRVVYCQLVRRDQYSRIVCADTASPFHQLTVIHK